MAFGNCFMLSLVGILVCFSVHTVARETLVRGLLAPQRKFAFTVSLQVHGHGHECSGGIIGDTFILTAARCVLNVERKFLNPHISVHAGITDYRQIEPAAISVKVEAIYFPAEFQPTHQQTAADIAVLKVDSLETAHRENVKQLRIPRTDYVYDTATISGFGLHTIAIHGNRITGDNASELRYANVTVYSKKACEHAYLSGTIKSDKHLCAAVVNQGPEDPSGACLGDIGGPLVDNHTRIIGILSRIAAHCDELIAPAVYTRVFHYRNMILNVMKHNRDPHMIAVYPFP